MKSVRNTVQLPLAKKVLLLKTAGFVLCVRLALAVFPFRSVQGWIARVGRVTGPANGYQTETIRQIIWAADVAGSFVLRDAACLTKALVAQVLLSRVGYDTELRIGVVKSPGTGLHAHAWLEREGAIVVGKVKGMERFTPLLPIEEPAL